MQDFFLYFSNFTLLLLVINRSSTIVLDILLRYFPTLCVSRTCECVLRTDPCSVIWHFRKRGKENYKNRIH